MSKKLLLPMLLLVLAAPLVGCDTNTASTPATSSSRPDGNKITVTYKDGDKVLKTEEIDKGTKATSYTPEKTGKSFVGWFAVPNLTHTFDFDQALTEDTTVFAAFASPYQKDERTWAIVGSGISPILAESNFGKVITDEMKMTRADKNDVNEFTYTVDLYKDDVFQFAINSSWNNQRGAGYLDALAIGDTAYFSGAATIGEATARKQNIKCIVPGNYTFTLKTYPADDYYDEKDQYYTAENKENFNYNNFDRIFWVRNGDAKPVEKPALDFYIKGEKVTEWEDRLVDSKKMTRSADNKTYTYTTPLLADDKFLFISTQTVAGTVTSANSFIKGSSLDTDDSTTAALIDMQVPASPENSNLVAKKKGLYTFTYNLETDKLRVTCDESKFIDELDYYIKGTFGNTNWGTEFNADYKLAKDATDEYLYVLPSISLAVDDEFGFSSWAPGTTKETMNEAGNRKDYMGYSYMGKAKETNANGNFELKGTTNFKCTVAGTYRVTYNAYSGIITFENATA